jgi:hypothetical protein
MFVSPLSTGEFAIDQKAVETSGAEQVLPAAAPAGQPEQGPGAHILSLHCRVPCFDLFNLTPHTALHYCLLFYNRKTKYDNKARQVCCMVWSQCSK